MSLPVNQPPPAPTPHFQSLCRAHHTWKTLSFLCRPPCPHLHAALAHHAPGTWAFSLSLRQPGVLQRGLAPRSKGKARAELRPHKSLHKNISIIFNTLKVETTQMSIN